MEAKLYNKDSWHYRLAKTYGLNDDLRWGYPTDICEYTRSIMLGMLVVVCLAIGPGILIGSIVDSILYWTFSAIVGSMIEPNIFAVLGTAVFFLSSIVGACYGLDNLIKLLSKKHSKKIMKHKEPSFIVSAYRAFKEKYCFEIEFK